jgi:hypothetical protein
VVLFRKRVASVGIYRWRQFNDDGKMSANIHQPIEQIQNPPPLVFGQTLKEFQRSLSIYDFMIMNCFQNSEQWSWQPGLFYRHEDFI